MNREILFRGKRLDNGEWVYGYLRVFDDGSYHITTKVERNVARHIDGKPFYTLYGVEHEVYPETVGQYTGLEDKNGVKIFECDILRVTDDADEINERDSDTGIGEVTWLDKWLLWYVSNVDNGLGDLNDVGYLEVIGNKWDNPDLLEV